MCLKGEVVNQKIRKIKLDYTFFIEKKLIITKLLKEGTYNSVEL